MPYAYTDNYFQFQNYLVVTRNVRMYNTQKDCVREYIDRVWLQPHNISSKLLYFQQQELLS